MTLYKTASLQNKTPCEHPLYTICSVCLKYRREDGSWVSKEDIIEENNVCEINQLDDEKKRLSHGLCEDCLKIELEKIGSEMTRKKVYDDYNDYCSCLDSDDFCSFCVSSGDEE